MSGKTGPKYREGDRVTITDRCDPDYGIIFNVTGLSPSTKKRRSKGGQWRYRLSNGAYINEKDLERAK